MSLRKGLARVSLRSKLLALRARIVASGEREFLVLSNDPAFPRRERFSTFDEADNRAGDLASIFKGVSFIVQERIVLDGLPVLIRSKNWQYNESGVVLDF